MAAARGRLPGGKGAGEQVAQGGKGYAQLVGNASGAGKEILKKDGSEKASITLTGFGL